MSEELLMQELQAIKAQLAMLVAEFHGQAAPAPAETIPPPTRRPYSRKELASRWQCSARTIARMEKKGLIKRCEKIPGLLYTPESVEACEMEKRRKIRCAV